MTNAPTPTEKSKKQRDNIKKRYQTLRLHNNVKYKRTDALSLWQQQ